MSRKCFLLCAAVLLPISIAFASDDSEPTANATEALLKSTHTITMEYAQIGGIGAETLAGQLETKLTTDLKISYKPIISLGLDSDNNLAVQQRVVEGKTGASVSVSRTAAGIILFEARTWQDDKTLVKFRGKYSSLPDVQTLIKDYQNEQKVERL